MRYALNLSEILNEAPWEMKSTIIFYLELFTGSFLFSCNCAFLISADFVKLTTYLSFFMIVLRYYGLPLHIIRDLYMAFKSFVNRLNDWSRFRRATVNMHQRYPDATPAELAQMDRTCIICREDMESAKKLPCGHMFHFHCLRSWLERQQSCPTCRTPVLDQRIGSSCSMLPGINLS